MKRKTVHVHRTIMFKELEKVMDYSTEKDNYAEALQNNVFGKKSADGIKQTSNFLTRIYLFDAESPFFRSFKYFWQIAGDAEKPLITFLFAFSQDYLLHESLPVIMETKLGEKVTLEAFKESLEKHYPNKYSKVTSHSIGKNLASSWKQAGFIEGKTKNIRVQPEITFTVAAFAFFLAYLKGDRGEFILRSPIVNSLCLNENRLRELAIEASMQELLQYQYGGSVTSFSFPQLISKLNFKE
jgi:hypothetical protein